MTFGPVISGSALTENKVVWSAESLGGSRKILILYGQRRGRSLRAQRLLCNDLWPSYFRLRFDRKQSCLDGKLDRKVRIGRNPWYRVPNRPGWHGAHIYHRKLRYNTH